MMLPHDYELLRRLQECLAYVVQQKDRRTGEWVTVGNCVRGRTAAFEQLNSRKKSHRGAILRVISKSEADKYREGITLGRMLGPVVPGVSAVPPTQPCRPAESQPVPARQGHNQEGEK
jgi:hypothetical protein